MHVHLIAVAGTGMGALAGLLQALGHRVSGSDVTFDPPMGPALERWGIELVRGFDPSHLVPRPDLVIVGNVCRRDNPEARAAIDGGLGVTDMAHALADLVLRNWSPLVVAGTHGKTTTTAMCAWLLCHAGRGAGFLIGGLPKNFEQSFRAPSPSAHLPEPSAAAFASAETALTRRTPFVVEGDEYDTAFFEKTPKFWHYLPEVAILSSIEHDHIDIYPTFDIYLEAFSGFVSRIPAEGLLVAAANDPYVVSVARNHARCKVLWFSLQGDDTHGQRPNWSAAPCESAENYGSCELFVDGVGHGRFTTKLGGTHNARNAVAAMAAVCHGYGLSVSGVRASLEKFDGVQRRQDLIGTPRGIHVYDDFAHHPTAVLQTLRALRARHRTGTLFAVFEPRSATACRALHQDSYAQAFGSADRVILAPIGRSTIAESERLDVRRLAAELEQTGKPAHAASGIDEIITLLVDQARSGDSIVLLSNGSFGGIHRRLLEALSR